MPAVINGAGNVVKSASVVVDPVGVDGQVAGIVDILVPEGKDNPHGRKGTDKAVEGAKERHHQRVRRVPEEDVPIPGGERIQTEAVVDTGDDVEIAMAGCNPANPVELGKRRKNVAGEPEPDKHGCEHEVEEVQPRDSPNLSERASDWRVATGVECRVERNGDEGGGPHAVRGIHDEATDDAGHAIANKVGGESNEDLVGKVRGVRLVEELRQILDPDDVVGIWCVVGDVGHDGNEHVLFSGKGSWVQAVSDAHDGDADIWKPSLSGLSNWVRQQLGDVGHDSDGGLADIEKLVDKGEQGAKHQANGPTANRRGESSRVILVADDGSDFGVGAIAGDEGRLEFHLENQVLMLLGVEKDVLVLEKGADFINDGGWKVGVVGVNAMDTDHDVADLVEGVFRGELLGLEEVVFGDVEVMLGSGLLLGQVSVVFFI